MELSKSELNVLMLVAKSVSVLEMVKLSGLSKSQVYRTIKSLMKKDLIEKKNSLHVIKSKTHVKLLCKLLIANPNLIDVFSDKGLLILSELSVEYLSLKILCINTGLHKTTILKKLNKAINISLVIKNKRLYGLNDLLWGDVKEFLLQLRKYESEFDLRVPLNSVIYFKNKEEVLFSNEDDLDFQKTAFSCFDDFGLKSYLLTNYYYFPKKKLSKKQIFKHALIIADVENEHRLFILTSLFYFKFKSSLKNVKHSVIDKIKAVSRKEKVKDFISFDELKEKAKVYGVVLN